MKILHQKTGILILCISVSFYHLSAQITKPQSSGGWQKSGLRETVIQDAASVNRWWWGWLGAYSAATIGQGIAGITADKLSFRQDMFLSAATTFAGVAGQLISPVQPVKFRKWREMDSSGIPEQTRNEEYLKYLEKMAVAEKKGRGWQMHLASGAVNLTSGMVTWLGFKRTWKDGLMNFALNTVVTEAQIWSQPVKAKKYLAKFKEPGNVSQFYNFCNKPDNLLTFGSTAGSIWLKFSF
jgi:hypothetical protein